VKIKTRYYATITSVNEINVFFRNTPLLLSLAKKYIWWQTPSEAMENPRRILASAMNIGSLEDCHVLLHSFDRALLVGILKTAAPGWFSHKSWVFWHHLLDVIDVIEQAPPLPQRIFT